MNKELQELFSKAGNMISQLGRYNGNDNETHARKALRNISEYLIEFFDSNVCIPKGVNRHPDADILHQWIEGAEVEFSLKGQWISFSNINDVYTEGEGVRIKPPEPIYEWQWLDPERVQSSFDTSYIRTRFLAGGEYITEEEANRLTCYGGIYKLNSTKRVRQ